jgi:hypothetical protein
MDTITIKKNKISLNPNEIQISPLCREFRLSGISIDYSKSPKYINNNARHCTTYTFIYLDTKELFSFYFDEYDKFLYKL